MPTLMSLPNEILISIIDVTGPEDVVSFSTCCKRMYSLASRRLKEHKEKKSLFSTLFVEDYLLPRPKSSWGANHGTYDTDLKELFSDARNRLYPKAMILVLPFNVISSIRTSDFIGFDEFGYPLNSSMAEVHSMIALAVGEIEAEDWIKDVKAGYPLATFLLLLALLPNLEKCSILTVGNWHRTSSVNYSKIIRVMIEAGLGQKGNGISFGGRLLKYKANGNFYAGIGESLLPFMMMLPRMQTIQGSSLLIEHGSWSFADAVSPVVDLDLHGAIHTATLSNYVCGIRELKRFGYIYASDPVIEWDPCRIVATLKQLTFRSLVHLDLTTDVSEDRVWLDTSPGIGSLRSFEVLETVRLHYLLLFEEVQNADSAANVYPAEILGRLPDDASVNALVEEQILLEKSLIKGQILIDFLPSSVRTLHLEDIAKGRLVLDTLEGLPEHRVERLPYLELIKLDAGDEFNSQIEQIRKEAGVQLELSKANTTSSDTSER